MAEQRRYYRIVYPPEERPTFTIQGKKYEVLDISEKGMSFVVKHGLTPARGIEVKGVLTFRDGQWFELIGQIIRYMSDSGVVALNLRNRIPLPKIMEEQRYIFKKYPREE